MNFYFFFTPFECTAKLPFEILPGHLLDKANSEEIELIRESLGRYAPPFYSTSRYESKWQEHPGEHISAQLPSEEFRYWVIRFQGWNVEEQKLSDALLITEPGLEVGWAFVRPLIEGCKPAPAVYLEHTSSFFNQFPIPGEKAPLVSEIDLATTQAFVPVLEHARIAYPAIGRAVQNYRSTLSLSRFAWFPLLSYFALIEALITHKPDPSDPTQSLTRQISRKMVLLAKRMEPPLNHREHFPDQQLADPIKFWKALYGIRSDIAHGNIIEPKQLKLFGSKEKIREFLLFTARSLIRCAVREPDLVMDLQQC